MTVLIRDEGRLDHHKSDGGQNSIVEPVPPSRGGVRMNTASSSRGSMTRRRSSMIQLSLYEMKKPLLTLTTEEIYGVEDTTEFYGPYAHLRKILDYTHYRNYTQQRQWLQDAIIEDLVDHIDGLDETNGGSNSGDVCITPTEPWLIFTVGVRGAGKAHTMRELVQSRKIPLLSYVPVDRDYIRRRLPEYTLYGQQDENDNDDGQIFGGFDVNYMTRKEAGVFVCVCVCVWSAVCIAFFFRL